MYRIYTDALKITQHFQTMIVSTLALNNKALRSQTAVYIRVYVRQCFLPNQTCYCWVSV